MSKGQLTGMAGVYFVAAEASLRGFIVSPTSRGAHAADLLITDLKCRKAFSIQVKTNRSANRFWLMNEKCQTLKSGSLFYALVNIVEKKTGKTIEYYLVPSKVVARRRTVSPASATRKNTGYSIYKNKIEEFKDGWSLLK